MDSMNTDDKYITFNRDEFHRYAKRMVTGQGVIDQAIEEYAIKDAVVIRRQDYFATAALAGYANSIAIAAKLTDDPKKRDELIAGGRLLPAPVRTGC